MIFYCSGIGQPLSLLLKLTPAVSKLALYDIVHTPGVAADLSHCETRNTLISKHLITNVISGTKNVITTFYSYSLYF